MSLLAHEPRYDSGVGRGVLALGCLVLAACDGQLRFSEEATVDAAALDAARVGDTAGPDASDGTARDAGLCPKACPLSMPVCDPATGACVRCLGESDCGFELRRCVERECVACAGPKDCKEFGEDCDTRSHRCRRTCSPTSPCGGSSTPDCSDAGFCGCNATSCGYERRCSVLTATCVVCRPELGDRVKNIDCRSDEAPYCLQGLCVECVTDEHCPKWARCDALTHHCRS